LIAIDGFEHTLYVAVGERVKRFEIWLCNLSFAVILRFKIWPFDVDIVWQKDL